MTGLRYFLEFALLLMLSGFFKLVGLDKASAIGGTIGRFIGPRLATSRKARRNLQNALPHLSNEQLDDVIKGMWDNLGRLIAEYPHLEQIAQERLQMQGQDYLQAALAKGRGAVLFSAHMANWETVPPYIQQHFNIQVNLMYRAPNNERVDRLLTHYRTLGGKMRALTKSRRGGQAAMKALRDGEIIGILIDQKYNEGISIPFFGIPAMTNPIFVKMAQKYDAPLLPFMIERTQGAHFKVRCYPEIKTMGRSSEDVIVEAHSLLEKWISKKPEQWLWLHRRWN
jgi:KDO2-lipid IV(A) lauroyltransferase